jgi:succinate dehydrogenase / fumarate reductase cytochrome b subunit
MIERPLSPHLMHYKPEISSSLSILHRITGIALALGLPVLAWWICSVAAGGELQRWTATILGSIPGQILLFGWTVALSFHLLNGIRHLGWDTDHGFGMDTAHRTGWWALAGAVILTAVIWLIVVF